MSTSTKENQNESDSFECTCLAKCSHFIQVWLERIFARIGRVVGNHPWLTILCSVLFSSLFSAGFTNWTTESRAEKLWIPQNTLSEQQGNWVSDTFGFETRSQSMLLRPKDEGNVLTAKYVEQYWIAHYLMVNHSAKAMEGYEDQFPGKYSWDGYEGSTSICLRIGQDCDMQTILDIVGYEYNDIATLTDEKLLELVNDYDDKAALPRIIGGLEYDESDAIISGAIFAGSYSVAAAAIDVGGQYEDPSREQWESEVNAIIQEHKFEDANVIPAFEAAFSEEFGGAIARDGQLFSAGLFLLVIYTTIALGKRDHVHSMFGLSMCAVITVGLACMGGFGLAAACGILWTTLSSSLPFLALGLGVDDAFIIVGEFQQQIKSHLKKGQSEMDGAELMEHTMKHAGVSILITSFTDFMAFSIGAQTALPALSSYCLFAAFGVLFVFLLNITFFAACVVIDYRRSSANRMDCCCCITLKQKHYMYPELMVGTSTTAGQTTTTEVEQNERPCCCVCCHLLPSEISGSMFKWIGEQIIKLHVKIPVILVAFGTFCFAVYGATQLEQDFDIRWFLPDDSYLQESYEWNDEFFSFGTPLFIYSKDIDYYANEDNLLESNYLLRNASYLQGTARDWHLAFLNFVDSDDYNGTMISSSDEYYIALKAWLDDPKEGAQYSGVIAWKDENDPVKGINGAFMIGEYKDSAVVDAAAQVVAMNSIRSDMSDITDDTDGDIFGFTFAMIFWEQYAVIAGEFYRNLVAAVCVVFVITIILIPKISAALLVILSVVVTIVDVLGFMWLWGLTIDGVTVVYTVIAIGLAVDYSAHIGEAYVLSTAKTRNDKVVDALNRVGASVFNGAFSTFLAVAAMGLSQTYVFRVFFRQFFLVTLLGSVHGLIVLPALLSIVGPKKAVVYESDDDEKELSPKSEGNKKYETQIPASTPNNDSAEEIEMNMVNEANSTDTKSTDSLEE